MKILTTDQVRVGMVLASIETEELSFFDPQHGPFHFEKHRECGIKDRTIIAKTKFNGETIFTYGNNAETAPSGSKFSTWCIDDEHDLRSAVLVARILNNQQGDQS